MRFHHLTRAAARAVHAGSSASIGGHFNIRLYLWLEQMLQDLRISARSLLKSPGFSIIAVSTLALGIGANTAIFSLIDSILLKTLPVVHPEQLLQVNMSNRDLWGAGGPYFSNPVWEQLRDRQDIFSGVFAYSTGRFNLAPRGEARYVQGNFASGQFFSTLGLRPILGRTFTVAEDRTRVPWNRRPGLRILAERIRQPPQCGG